jgi:hypothetical protein
MAGQGTSPGAAGPGVASQARWPSGAITTVNDAQVPPAVVGVSTVLAAPGYIPPSGASAPAIARSAVGHTPPPFAAHGQAPAPFAASFPAQAHPHGSSTGAMGMTSIPRAPPRAPRQKRPLWPVLAGVTGGAALLGGIIVLATRGGSAPTSDPLARPPVSTTTTTAGPGVAIGVAPLHLGGAGTRPSANAESAPEGCSDAAMRIYLVDTEGNLHSFDPRSLEIRDIGRLSCASRGTPNSMALDRTATAWVSFTDGAIFKVSTSTAGCERTAFDPAGTGWKNFAMAFASNAPQPGEALFLSNADTATLASVDTSTMRLTVLGKYPGEFANYMPDIAGTADGRLYGFFSKRNAYLAPTIAQINKRTAEIMSDRTQDGVRIEGTYSVGFFGGHFYMFTQKGSGTSIARFKQHGDDKPTTLKEIGFKVVGSGTSTCNPAWE